MKHVSVDVFRRKDGALGYRMMVGTGRNAAIVFGFRDDRGRIMVSNGRSRYINGHRYPLDPVQQRLFDRIALDAAAGMYQ